MDLNKETALRLWNKSFGKSVDAFDFAGRKINKGAYNDRNSEFGWNIDHILPQSKGGKTDDYNLICCHILTNDEKADKFPTFNSNNKKFEILKENHYEIHQIIGKKEDGSSSKSVNFKDATSGICLFDKLKKEQKKGYVGSVLVEIRGIKNSAIIYFIKEIFKEECAFYIKKDQFYLGEDELRIILTNYNITLSEDFSKILDKCVLLNTYFKGFFIPCKYIHSYEIYYQVQPFNVIDDIYKNANQIYFRNINNSFSTNTDCLYIDETVCSNSKAKEKVSSLNTIHTFFDINKKFYCYNYYYGELRTKLQNEVNKK